MGFQDRFKKNMEKYKQQKGGNKFEEDPNQLRFDVPETGTLTIKGRFIMPNEDDIDGFFVTTYKHELPQGDEKVKIWCPRTIGEKCSCCNFVRPLWNEGREDDYRAWSAKASNYALFLVLDHPQQPEVNGKVMVLPFKKTIAEKLDAHLTDKDGHEPYNVFDPDTGYDFYLKVKIKAKYVNYDESSFVEEPRAIETKHRSAIESHGIKLSHYIERIRPYIKTDAENAEKFEEVTGQRIKLITDSKSKSVATEARKALEESSKEEAPEETRVDTKVEEKPKTEKTASRQVKPIDEDPEDLPF